MLDDSCVASCRVGKTYQSCQPAGAIFLAKHALDRVVFFTGTPLKS